MPNLLMSCNKAPSKAWACGCVITFIALIIHVGETATESTLPTTSLSGDLLNVALP